MSTLSVPPIVNGFLIPPVQPKENWSLGDFELLHRLGSGNYGQVYLASVKGCNYLVALKKLNIEKMEGHDIAGQLRREVEIAFHTRHKYLLRTYGYFFDETDVYLIMESCSRGMLYSEMMKVKCFPPNIAAKFVAQLAEALLYLHRHHILHRDIKPENILLDHHMNIKLADFGWSVHDPSTRRRTACGTPEYFPPEIVTRQAYDTTADMWCLGIFCFELLVGRTPFAVDKTHDEVGKDAANPPKGDEEIYTNIKRGTFAMPEHLPEEAKDLISSLLVREGSKRLALHKVVRHSFLMKYYYEPNNISPPADMKRKREN